MLTFSEEETEPQEFSRREALREVGVQDCLRADTNHGGGGSDQFPTKDSWNKQILQQHAIWWLFPLLCWVRKQLGAASCWKRTSAFDP